MEAINKDAQEEINAPASHIPIAKKRGKYKKSEKIYTVNIIYVPISEEQAKIKIAAIRDIIKRSHFKKP